MVLHFYILIRLHHELCSDQIYKSGQSNTRLFGNYLHALTLCSDQIYKSGQSNTRLFGNYLHALTVHAPVQYQTMSLLSVNAENQENLFSKAKRISLRATNRKVDNVLPAILLGFQVRQKMCCHKPIALKQNSIIRSVASKIPPYKGTAISKNFVKQKLQSWQAHLEHVSLFLKEGDGTCWQETSTTYNFKDSDQDQDFQSEGPELLHSRAVKQTDVEHASQSAWEEIILQNKSLPTPSVRLYDTTGKYRGTRTMPSTDSEPTQNINTTQQAGQHTDQFLELTKGEYYDLHDNEEVDGDKDVDDSTPLRHDNHLPTTLFSNSELETSEAEAEILLQMTVSP